MVLRHRRYNRDLRLRSKYRLRNASSGPAHRRSRFRADESAGAGSAAQFRDRACGLAIGSEGSAITWMFDAGSAVPADSERDQLVEVEIPAFSSAAAIFCCCDISELLSAVSEERRMTWTWLIGDGGRTWELEVRARLVGLVSAWTGLREGRKPYKNMTIPVPMPIAQSSGGAADRRMTRMMAGMVME